MVQNSVICQFFVQLWTLVLNAWPESWLCRALDALAAWAARTAGESRACAVVRRDGRLATAWDSSLTCRVMSLLLNLPCALCRAVYQAAKGLWDGSAVFRVLSAVGGLSFALMGLFIAVMLVAPHDIWNNLYALAGAVVLTAIFALGSASRRSLRLEVERLSPWFILFLGMAATAFLTSLSWDKSVRFVGFYITVLLLVLLTISAVKTYDQLQLLVALAVLGVTAAAVYGCYQGVTGVEVVANQQDLYVNAGMPGRAYSFFDNPNNFAELLVMLTPLTFALFLNAETWKGRAMAAGSFALCVAALGFTLSRSGFLGLALAAVVFLAFENWKLIPLLIAVGIGCLPLLPEFIFKRILTIGNMQDSSTSYRFAIYGASEVLMKDYWFKGVGLGSDVLKETFKNYPAMFDGNWPIHTHNNYLQVWAEMGIFGLVAFLGAILCQLKAGIQAFAGCSDRRLKRLLAAALAGFAGILLISVAEYTWFYPRNMFVYWFLFAIIAACGKLSGKTGGEREENLVQKDG